MLSGVYTGCIVSAAINIEPLFFLPLFPPPGPGKKPEQIFFPVRGGGALTLNPSLSLSPLLSLFGPRVFLLLLSLRPKTNSRRHRANTIVYYGIIYIHIYVPTATLSSVDAVRPTPKFESSFLSLFLYLRTKPDHSPCAACESIRVGDVYTHTPAQKRIRRV